MTDRPVVETETIGSLKIEGLGMGPWVFLVSAVLSLLGAVVMFTQARFDAGPVENTSN